MNEARRVVNKLGQKFSRYIHPQFFSWGTNTPFAPPEKLGGTGNTKSFDEKFERKRLSTEINIKATRF